MFWETIRAWSRMVVKRDHLEAAAHHKGASEVEGEEGREVGRRDGEKRWNGDKVAKESIP